jgi:hypothetical protein
MVNKHGEHRMTAERINTYISSTKEIASKYHLTKQQLKAPVKKATRRTNLDAPPPFVVSLGLTPMQKQAVTTFQALYPAFDECPTHSNCLLALPQPALQAAQQLIQLDPNHHYTVLGQSFRSVSSILDTNTEPFDRSLVAASFATKQKVSFSQAMAHVDACMANGTRGHKAIETRMLTNIAAESAFFTSFFVKCLLRRFLLLGVEVKLCDLVSKCAGTVDLVACPVLGIGKQPLPVVLFDWKFSKAHSPTKRYKAQLNLYRALATLNGYNVVGMYLVYFHQSDPHDFFLHPVPVDDTPLDWLSVPDLPPVQ